LHYLVISKRPEFTDKGEVVPSQCEPDTGDWQLNLVLDGNEERLVTGIYNELRTIQRACAGKPPEAIRAIAARPPAATVERQPSDGLAPDDDDDVDMISAEDMTQIVDALGPDDDSAAGREDGAASVSDVPEWIAFSERQGVKVAAVRRAGGSLDVDEFFHAIVGAIAPGSRGIVLDIGKLDIGHKLLGILREISDNARSRGCFLGIVGASAGLIQAVKEASLGEKLRLFPSLDAAVRAALGGRQ